MGILNDLSKKAQEYAGIAVDKAKDLAEVAADKAQNLTDTAKVNMAILSEQRELDKNYRAIGEWFVSEYEGEIPDAVKDVVAAVNASKERIAELEASKPSKDAPVVDEEQVTVKDMTSGEQTTLPFDETLSRIQVGLAERNKGKVIVEK